MVYGPKEESGVCRVEGKLPEGQGEKEDVGCSCKVEGGVVGRFCFRIQET